MKTRVVASFTHFLASIAVISLFLLVVYFIWYPGPLSDLHDVLEAIKVVIGVDIVLGPLLTLIIFDVQKPRKKLVMDLSIIVLVQISALAWGAYMTHKARPVFVVYHDEVIYSIARNDIPREKMSSNVTMPSFWQLPKHFYISKLTAQEIMEHVQNKFTKGEQDIQFQVARYLPMEDHKEDMLEHAMDMTAYLKKKGSRSKLDKFLQCHGGTMEKYAFYPMEYGFFKSIVGVDRNNLELIGSLTE